MSGKIISQKCSLSLNRRQFLGSCSAGAAGLAAFPFFSRSLLAQSAQPLPPADKTRLRLVFTHRTSDKATWPYKGFDYQTREKELTEKLRQACPHIDFLPITVQNADDAKNMLQNDKNIDGYLVYMLGLWSWAPLEIAAANLPTIFVDDLYGGSGEFLRAFAAARRKKLKVIGVSSSRFDDVVDAITCVNCVKMLRSSVILEVGSRPDWWGYLPYPLIEEHFGTKVVPITFDQLNEVYNKIDSEQARQCAQRWIDNAEKIVEPTTDEIRKSAAMYLALASLMQQHNARAVTVNCLDGFYKNKITAYPCLGFSQLNDDHCVGVCEADMNCTVTMLVMSYLTSHPGYISDPVIDTSKNQIIYAHCVAPKKVFGPDGPASPYHIRSHSEDRSGAAVRSILPLGEITTTILFSPQKRQIILHQGKAVANIDEDKACRTKLAVEVIGDIDKLLNYWDLWTWHRVTYYGDHKQRVRNIATLLDYELIEEA